MRRSFALVLLVAGVFLLAFGPLLRWGVYPALAKAPLDQNTVSVNTGSAQYLDATAAVPATTTGDVTVVRDIVTNAAAQAKVDSSTTAVWQVTTVVNTPQTKSLKQPDEAFSWLTETWAFDRNTGKPTADSEVQAEAFLKFPFQTQKRTYSYWDSKAGQAFPALYVGTEDYHGRQVYRFESVVPPTQIPSPIDPSTSITYSNPSSVALVDPETGVIVGGSSHQIVTSDGITVFDSVLTPDKASVDDLLVLASNGDALTLMRGPALLVSVLLGLVLIAAAVWLLLTDRRSREADLRDREEGDLRDREAVRREAVDLRDREVNLRDRENSRQLDLRDDEVDQDAHHTSADSGAGTFTPPTQRLSFDQAVHPEQGPRHLDSF